MRKKPVSIVLCRLGDKRARTMFRCNTIKQAESWIERRMKTDPKGVNRGDYGIDAPETMVNPPLKKAG